MKVIHPYRFLGRIVTPVLCFSLSVGPLAAWGQEESFSVTPIRSSLREHYSSNRDNRFLIKVQVWGDSPVTGIFHLPDNATMIDLMGLTGGPMGVFSNTVITLTATQDAVGARKDKPSMLKIEGREIIDRKDYRTFPLQNGDIVTFESPPKSDHFLRTIGIIGSVLGLVTTGLTLYLAFRPRN